MKRLLLVAFLFIFLLVACEPTDTNGCISEDKFEFGKIEVQRTLFDTDIETFGTDEIFVLVYDDTNIELSDTVYANAKDGLYSNVCYKTVEDEIVYDFAIFKDVDEIDLLTFDEAMAIYDSCLSLEDNLGALVTCNIENAEALERYNRVNDDSELEITYENWLEWKSE